MAYLVVPRFVRVSPLLYEMREDSLCSIGSISITTVTNKQIYVRDPYARTRRFPSERVSHLTASRLLPIRSWMQKGRKYFPNRECVQIHLVPYVEGGSYPQNSFDSCLGDKPGYDGREQQELNVKQMMVDGWRDLSHHRPNLRLYHWVQ